MGKKPTWPFGGINFGKDGRVRPGIVRFANDTVAQEQGAVGRFIAQSPEFAGAKIQALPQRDHDALLILPAGQRVEIQCTEIVGHDFLLPEGREARSSMIFEGKLRGIDEQRLERIVLKRIQDKQKYQKPIDADFVLLIWTTISAHMFGIRPATEFLTSQGPGPYDRIVLFDLSTTPRQIWPLDDRWKGYMPASPPPGKSGVFIPATEMQVRTSGPLLSWRDSDKAE